MLAREALARDDGAERASDVIPPPPILAFARDPSAGQRVETRRIATRGEILHERLVHRPQQSFRQALERADGGQPPLDRCGRFEGEFGERLEGSCGMRLGPRRQDPANLDGFDGEFVFWRAEHPYGDIEDAGAGRRRKHSERGGASRHAGVTPLSERNEVGCRRPTARWRAWRPHSRVRRRRTSPVPESGASRPAGGGSANRHRELAAIINENAS